MKSPRRLVISVLFLFIISASLSAQNINGAYYGIVQWYLNDSLLHFAAPQGAIRSMHFLDVSGRHGKWEAAFKAQYYLPGALIGYDPRWHGAFTTGYLQYTGERWQVRGGHIYEQFGSGMVLRLWNDVHLGIDNGMRGLDVQYTGPGNWHLKAVSGNPRVGMAYDDVWIGGADIQYDRSLPNGYWQTGFSAVTRYYTPENEGLPARVDLYGLRTSLSLGRWDLAFEYDYKTPDAILTHGIIDDRVLFDGDAYTFQLGYARKGMAWHLTARRLENIRLYVRRALEGNPYNSGLVNFVPVLVKQHDYPLATIYVYGGRQGISRDDQTVGEIGGQADWIFKIPRRTLLGGRYGTVVSFNMARWHALDATFIPALGVYRRPFWGAGPLYYSDINLEIKRKISKNLKAQLLVMHQIYNQKLLEGHGEEVRALTFTGDFGWRLGGGRSLRLEAGHLFTRQDKRNWAEAGLEYAFNEQWSFFANDMYNYGSTGIHYYNAGLVYTRQGNRIQLAYGRQRGGLVCTGGVCRYMPPSKGWQLSVSLSLL